MTDKENKNEIVIEEKVEAKVEETPETEAKTIIENYETLKATIEATKSDFEKFNAKKIKAAGQRARSNLLTIKKLCDTLRKQIIVDIKDIPIKHRIDTDDVTPEPLELKRETTGAPEAPEVEIELQPETVEEPIKKVRKTRRANKKNSSPSIV
jgi:hypothetical protein